MKSILTKGNIHPVFPYKPRWNHNYQRQQKLDQMGLFAWLKMCYNRSLKISSPRFPIPIATISSTLVMLTTPFFKKYKLAF